MKVANKELVPMIAKLNSLKGLVLDGDIALAAVELKNKLSIKFKLIEEAQTNVIEALCKKGPDGKPLKEMKEVSGESFFHYNFDSTEIQSQCTEQLEAILNDNFEVNIPVSKLTREMIGKMKCSIEQTEALLLLVPEKVMASV